MQLYQFLDRNIEALRRRVPQTVQWLEASGSQPRALEDMILVNRMGLMDLPLPEGGSLFGAMPPEAYYSRWNTDEMADRSATIIVGCNLGYGLNHVLTKTPPSHKVLLFEPSPAMLYACLGQSDYAPWMDMGKLFIFPPDKDIFRQVIQGVDLQLIHGKVHLHLDIPSQQVGPQYAALGGELRKALEGFTLEMTTLRLRQDVMLGNELANYHRAFADGSLEPLRGAGQGMSAVILGAGPSLAANAPALAASPGHALYLTALQTLPALRALGLKPHLCMAIDYSEGMLGIASRLDPDWCRDIPLVYSAKVRPEVVRDYPGPTIPLWTEGGLGTFALRGHAPVLDAGGNVSVTLLRFCAFLDVSQALLVGQDFSWKPDAAATHVSGHHAAARGFTFQPGQHITLKNWRGEDTVTAMPYLAAARDMEADIPGLGRPVFVAYGDGLPLRGARATDMDQVQSSGLLASRPGSLDRYLAALRESRRPVLPPSFEARSPQWSSSLRAVTRRLEKLFARPDRNSDEIQSALGQVHLFLRQDRLYAPYLFNEIMDLAGLVHVRARYTRPDLAEFKKIAKRSLDKVREMDRVLGQQRAPVQERHAA
ncbi:MAG: 6-hydroxymethylpterin diphosphokinase MptE-like protein [Thermodesulfobacteriota bacterium]